MPDPPPKPKYDMKRYRRAVRESFRVRQALYAGPDSLSHRDSQGRLRRYTVPYPELADFEIRQERRRDKGVDL